MSLTQDDYREALRVLDAVNLSGVVYSFSKVLPRIWEEAKERGEGTDYVNQHPISQLYAAKIMDLAGLRTVADMTRSYHLVMENLEDQ